MKPFKLDFEQRREAETVIELLSQSETALRDFVYRAIFLRQVAREHSCNYKIGHPLVNGPCPICQALE